MDRHTLWIKTDNRKRKLVLKYELKRLVIKCLKLNRLSSTANRVTSSFFLSRLNKLGSKSFVKTRCIITGRAKALDTNTGLSRFYFRKKAYLANLPGMRRAS